MSVIVQNYEICLNFLSSELVAAIERVMPAIDRRTGVAIEMLVIAVLIRLMALALVLVGMEIVEIAIVDVSAQWRIVHRKADPAFQASDAEFHVTLVPPAETIGLTLKPARLLAQLLRFLSADR